MNFKKKHLLTLTSLILISCNSDNSNRPRVNYTVTMADRENLPIADKLPLTTSVQDVRDVKEQPAMYQGVQAPDGAPNVVVFLMDDVGYSQSTVMGGHINTPTFAYLAKEGLLYTQFHTAAISSATRTALLTGRSHQHNNMGAISEIATSEPGNIGVRYNTISTVAKILKYNGYPTAMYGKTHEVPSWMTGPNGDKSLWPTGVGFDEYYGFVGGEMDQFQPNLTHGTTTIPTPRTPGYSLTTDLADHAISWIHEHKDMEPNKPVFVYFAPGATHAPHQPPVSWLNKYKGKFDKGWDVLREETFENQKKLGIIPADTKLPPMPDFVPRWSSFTPEQKKVYAREMEVYAAYLEYSDTEMGRVVDELKKMGQYDNTIFFYSLGDNGASAEGGSNGAINAMRYFNGVPEGFDEMMAHYNSFGTKDSEGNFAIGWAVEGDTPFAWMKQIAGDRGGTANPLVISWHKGIKARGEIRRQWLDVNDITPTILDVVNVPTPKKVDGVTQQPMDGRSFKATFAIPNVSVDRERYYEVMGSRAYYKDGWYARTIHKLPTGKILTPFNKDVWQLYDTTKDFALANDLSKSMPDKLEEMKKGFAKMAQDNYVYPMDDQTFKRLMPELVNRPVPIGKGMDTVTLHPTNNVYPEMAFLDMKNKDNTIIALVEIVDPANTSGVIISQGGYSAGWTLFVDNGIPKYGYNFLGLKDTVLVSSQRLKVGKNEIKYVFKYNENGKFPKGLGGSPFGKGGNMYLYLNGQLVATGKLENTVPNLFSADNGLWIGKNDGSAVLGSYSKKLPYTFNAKIDGVTVQAKRTPEEEKRYRAILAFMKKAEAKQ